MTDIMTLVPFAFDADKASKQFAETGWVHAPNGLTPEFFHALSVEIKRLVQDDKSELESWRFPGKKLQFLWELPAGLSIETLCTAVAEVAGFDPDRTVLAERHLKVYGDSAEEMPPAHKDRSASTLTVGIGIEVPPESRLVIWPTQHLEPNPFPTSAEWRQSRRPDQLPEKVLDGIAPVEVDMRAGDVVLFRGAEIYHERYRPANTSVLYLKFNEVGLDPLGEDPRTPELEARSAALLADDLPHSFAVRVSPRVIGFRTEEFFPSSARHTQIRMLDHDIGVSLTPAEVDLVRRVRDARSLDSAQLSDDEKGLISQLVPLGVLLLVD
jgi:hypothetical protein